MIPQALLLPHGIAEKHGGCYEVNHLGVTVRCEPSPRILRNVTRTVGIGEGDQPIVQSIVGDPDDLLVPDFRARGVWVVPARFAAAFFDAHDEALKSDEGKV